MVSSGDGSVSRTPSKPRSNVLKNKAILKIAKIAKVFRHRVHHGAVLCVDYEFKHCGFLKPVAGESSARNVYFKLPDPAGAPMTTVTLTGGMRLIPGDVMDYAYELAYNSHESRVSRAQFARLRDCKPRNVNELETYMASLLTTAKQHPEIVLRDITKCPAGFKLVLDYRNPSNDLLRHTLDTLSSSKHDGQYDSRLKQLYFLFNGGTQFLTSERFVQKRGKYLSTSDQTWSALLQSFLRNLLEFLSSQTLPTTIMPLLTRVREPRESDAFLFSSTTLRK